MTARILVVEDDLATSRMVVLALKSSGYIAEAARSYRQASEALLEQRFDLLLCDLYLGDGTGLELLKDIRDQEVPTPLVLFTAQGSVETAVEAIREGAFDYLAKPFQIADLLALVEKALESRKTVTEEALEPDSEPSLLIGNSPPMVDLYKRIALAARTDSPVLISGETGTGKELVARSLHEFSRRKNRPFVPVNCGALTETLLESELFGHERGSFTGAVASRKGLFEQAQGGTLFLDEISETSPGFQVKLLRALQEGEVRPVGGNRTVKVNVRVVAATNRDLQALMGENRFRQDLYYRLGVVHLHVPALRERKKDIPQLTAFFLQRISARLGRKITIDDQALQLLGTYEWPGNVRELENLIERIAVLKTGNSILSQDLEFLNDTQAAEAIPDLNELSLVEREKIVEVLKEARGNKAEAARRLGIERKSLYRKAKRLGINLDRPA